MACMSSFELIISPKAITLFHKDIKAGAKRPSDVAEAQTGFRENEHYKGALLRTKKLDGLQHLIYCDLALIAYLLILGKDETLTLSSSLLDIKISF